VTPASRGATPSAALPRSRKAPEPAFLYLTTTGRRTGLPREIEIWFTRRDDRVYLVAETGERARWVRNLRADPSVRWRVGSRVLTGRARVVDPVREAALVSAVRARSEAKYGWGKGLIVELRAASRGRARG
jgi:deazaflavin-dependent oxidoreductase (nitroreductase family)